MQLANFPFALHAGIESLAAVSFILNPESQLPNPSIAARLLLSNFGGLLITTNLICLIFLSRPFDETSRLVAISFAFWHVWPCHRAVIRLSRGVESEGKQGKTLGGPLVHLLVHIGFIFIFLGSALLGVDAS